MAVIEAVRAPSTMMRLAYSSMRSSVGVDDVLVAAVRRWTTRKRCGAGAQHRDLVCRAAQLEVDGAADRVLHLRAAAAGGLEQAGALDGLLVLVGLDAGGDERDAGVAVRDEAALAADPVDPAGVGASRR